MIAEILPIPVHQVMSGARLGEELGMESLDYVDLQFRLETEFRIQFFERELTCTDGEACLVAWAKNVPQQLEELRSSSC